MGQETVQPPRRDDRVVVEENQEFPLGQLDRLVVGRGEATVLVVQDHADPAVAPGEPGQECGGPVHRSVVHHDDLEIRMRFTE